MAENNIYKNTLKNINEFFSINPNNENFEKTIFSILKKIINFNSAYIFFINPEQIRLEYSQNSKLTKNEYNIPLSLSDKLFKGEFCKDAADILNIDEPYLAEPLSLKENIYGYIVITVNEFDDDVEEVFKSCAVIISNLIKDIEMSKIISMQVEALQEGISDVTHKNKKIVEADKLKTNFLANVTHELRTPLNSIIGFSELLCNELVGKLNEKQKEYLKDIQVSGLHLLGMINEILDLSKIEAKAMKLNKTEFNIQQAVNEVCNIVRPLAQKKNIGILTEVEDFTINADYQKIQQILFNLISNSIKFTQNNGEIIISAIEDKKNIIIKVKDNGIGIEKKFLKKIFDKFEQIHNNSIKNESSTGLGLTITKELVKLHKGKIKIDSIPKIGTTFTIILPI